MPHRAVLLVTIAGVLAGGVAVGYAVSRTGHHPGAGPGKSAGVTTSSPPSPTTSTTVQPQSTTTTTTSVPTVAMSVTVVVCPTSFGSGTPSSSPPTAEPVPPALRLDIPTALSGRVAVYSDSADRMNLLGPVGWKCAADYGADGSGGISVYPPGETGASALYGQVPFAPSPDEAIVGVETSSCFGCTLGQACPVFAAAAAQYQQEFGAPCPKTRPVDESVESISDSIVEFTDPPDIAGDGVPSGGPYTAQSVMTYRQNAPSWRDTCALPASDDVLCTAALDLFMSRYGAK